MTPHTPPTAHTTLGGQAAADVQPGASAQPGPHGQLADIDARLAELPNLAVSDQVEVFADIHQRLTAVLAGTGGTDAAGSDAVSSRGR
jgi:hypothetical protein